jgi:hypothetical protein
MFNRRTFFRRTVGAVLAGFITIPLVKPRRPQWIIPIIYCKSRRTLIENPEWVKAGPESNIVWFYNQHAFEKL